MAVNNLKRKIYVKNKSSRCHIYIIYFYVLLLAILMLLLVNFLSWTPDKVEAAPDGTQYGIAIYTNFNTEQTSMNLISVEVTYLIDGGSNSSSELYKGTESSNSDSVILFVALATYWWGYDFDSEITNIDLSDIVDKMSNYNTSNRKFVGFEYGDSSNVTSIDVLDSNLLDIDVDTGLSFHQIGSSLTAVWEDASSITLDKASGTGGTEAIYKFASESLPTTTSVTIPTLQGYNFLGYYSGNTQYITADGQIIQDESLWSSVPNTLVAHWQSLEINLTLTLNCTNFNNQSYTIYVFVDNELIQQVIPISDTIHINIVAEPNCDNIYVQFVRNYYTNINANGDNIAQIGCKVYLFEFIDTTINYSISIPNVNIGIIV